jgi:hypothetical protein
MKPASSFGNAVHWFLDKTRCPKLGFEEMISKSTELSPCPYAMRHCRRIRFTTHGHDSVTKNIQPSQ